MTWTTIFLVIIVVIVVHDLILKHVFNPLAVHLKYCVNSCCWCLNRNWNKQLLVVEAQHETYRNFCLTDCQQNYCSSTCNDVIGCDTCVLGRQPPDCKKCEWINIRYNIKYNKLYHQILHRNMDKQVVSMVDGTTKSIF